MRRRLWILIFVAAAARVAWWVANVSVIENEGVEYATIARTWFSGEGYLGILGGTEVMFPPLYSLLIGVIDFVVRDLVLAGRLVSFAAGLALVAIAFDLTRRVFGESEGLVAGSIAALHPLLIALSTSMYGESLAVCLVMACALFAIRAGHGPTGWMAAASGIAAGLAYLTRPEMILFAVIAAAYVGWSTLRRTGRWSTALRFASLPIVTSVLIALPYVVHLTRIAGHFRWEGKTAVNEVINQRMTTGMSYARASRGLDVQDDFAAKAPYLGGPELWADQSVYLRSTDQRAGATQGPVDLIRAVPGRVRGVLRFLATVSFEWTSVWRVPFGVLAILVGVLTVRWRKPETRDDALLLLAVLGLQAAFLLGVQFLWVRYVVPLLPLALPWMAAGIVWSCKALLGGLTRFTTGPLERWTLPVGIAAVLALCANAYPRIAAFEDFRQAQDSSLKEIGLWIRDHRISNGVAETQRRPVIMGYGAVVPFYANGFLNYLPHSDDVALTLRYMHWKAPDYVVLVPSEAGQGPYFEAWLRDGIPDPCAVLVHRAETPEGHIRVWEWRCKS